MLAPTTLLQCHITTPPASKVVCVCVQGGYTEGQAPPFYQWKQARLYLTYTQGLHKMFLMVSRDLCA